jgi:hypothetical protein
MDVYVIRKGTRQSAGVHAVLVLRTLDEAFAADARTAAPADDAHIDNVRTDEKPETGLA